jgi:hypothetical protein
MNIGFVNEETWAFVNEIYAELDRRQSLIRFASQPHQIPLLAGRLNRGKFERDLRRFLAQNQRDSGGSHAPDQNLCDCHPPAPL